jgi:cell shape-determining protein MreD
MHLCLVLLGLLFLCSLLIPVLRGSDRAFGILRWSGSLFLAALCYATYRGYIWARLLLAVPVLMMIIACGTMIQRQAANANPSLLAYWLASLLSAILIIWFLVGSPSVRYFLAAQRQPPN